MESIEGGIWVLRKGNTMANSLRISDSAMATFHYRYWFRIMNTVSFPYDRDRRAQESIISNLMLMRAKIVDGMYRNFITLIALMCDADAIREIEHSEEIAETYRNGN